IHQPLDAGKGIFDSLKAGAKRVVRNQVDISNPLLSRNLANCFKEFNEFAEIIFLEFSLKGQFPRSGNVYVHA
ncbi:MAG: hypothetical protein ACK43J_04625, partial [Chitinophagaceae bacterium]